MLSKTRTMLLIAAAALPLMVSQAWADGLISIIVNDPANPYWQTEGQVAQKTAEGLGYTATVAAHKGDTNTESTLIEATCTASFWNTDRSSRTAHSSPVQIPVNASG